MGESDLDVPEPLFSEACAAREAFCTLPLGLEGLALNTDRLHWYVDVCVTQSLAHSRFRRPLLAQALGAAFRLFAHPARVNAPACGAFGKRDRRDATPKAGGRDIPDAVMFKHRSLLGRDELRAIVRHLAGLRIEIERKSGERPGNIVGRDRTIRRHCHEHTPH
jgi:hypothetical protein